MNTRYCGAFAILFVLIVSLHPARADDLPLGIVLVPKKQQFKIDPSTNPNDWQVRFKSLPEFVDALYQPEFKTLSSGETALVYYVFFQAKPDILIFAYSFKKEEKRNGSFYLSGRGDNPTLRDIPLTPIPLLDATGVAPPVTIGPIIRTDSRSASLIGYGAKIDPAYAGPLTMTFQLWTQGTDQSRTKAAQTINWKSTL